MAAPQGAPVELARDLDSLFTEQPLSRALVAVHVTSLADASVLYRRNHDARVIPGSALKLVTVAAAAERLGWSYRFSTTLTAAGSVANGVLTGNLIVTGTGDPSIVAQDLKGAALFDEWTDALIAAGIRRVDGRLIGDDNVFRDEPLGAGWAWDYLTAGYAAPSGAISYNENVAVVRVTPTTDGAPARVEVAPPGHGLEPRTSVTTGPSGSAVTLTISRPLGQRSLTIAGRVPAGGATIVRTTTVENPTLFFLDAFNQQLAARGIVVTGGTRDIDDLAEAPAAVPGRTIAKRESEPLSSLAGYALKVSQNYYAEMLLKATGRGAGPHEGSTDRGRQAARDVLGEWGIATEPLVMNDGSGLSRYNYASAELLTDVLAHVWRDERLRGPFVAALPVGGRDGTLSTRMRNAALERRVQAKTGTLDNVRALAGYLHRDDGTTLAFSMIANHFTAPVAEVDGLMERALERLAK